MKKSETKMTTRHSPKKDAPSQSGRLPTGNTNHPPQSSSANVPPDSEDFWAKMGGMLGGLEARMKKESDQVKEQLGVAVDTLGLLGTRVDRAERRLDGLTDEVNSIIERKLASLETDQLSTSGRPSTQPPSSYASAAASTDATKQKRNCPAVSPEKKREDDYWTCRKALRLRPVGQGDTHTEVRKFMTEHLKLDSQFMESIGPFTAVRVPAGPAAKIRGEVIVSFQSIDVRDAVKGSARNLAGKGRDYGVRLELPNHLKSAMKALQSASFEIKSRFGEARRTSYLMMKPWTSSWTFPLGRGSRGRG